MKNFTSQLFKLILFSLIINLGALNASGAGSWASNYYRVVSDNTADGYVKMDVLYQMVGGDGSVIPIGADLYLQYESSNGTWVNCMWIYQYGTRNYSFNGQNGMSIGTTGTQTGFFGGAGQYHTNVTIYSNPSGIYNAPVNFRWNQVTRGVIAGSGFTLTFYKPDAPIGVTASTNECNKIDISWSAPGNKSQYGTHTYQIYRNGGYLGETSSTSYSYTTPADGTEYEFTVRLLTVYNGSYNYGVLSTGVTGNSIPNPNPPSNLSASNDRCDGTVYVQWQWLSTTPDNFELQRSTSPTSGFSTIGANLPGDRYYFEDTPPLRNTIYYYRARTKNNCGDWGSYSSPVQGYAPDAPATPGNVAHTFIGTTVRISWTDNSFNEDKFIITRINLNTGVTNDFEVNANVTFYEDDNAQLCIPYEYEVKAASNCGSSNAVSSGNVILSPDLGNTFPANSFKASKGYFADIVHMEWDNNNRNQINSYYIYRKVYGSSDSTLLSTLDGAQASYDDSYAENGIVYEYSIIAEGLCDTLSVWSNVANDIGFRNPAGTVSGKITYGSGEPVKGVTVTAESDEQLPTTSLQLNGSTSYLEIPNNSAFNIQNEFSFQAYVRLSQIKSSAIFNKGNQYILNYTGTAFEFSVGGNTLTFSHAVPLDTFIHVSAIFDGSSSSLYLDGKLMAAKSGVSTPANTSSPFIIGKQASANFLNGYVDEIRIWNVSLDSTAIKRDYNRYISYRSNGLMGYYRLNENISINTFYDISKSPTEYNENHGTRYNTSYSNTVPLIQQLWFKGLTDKNGDYLITGIPYFTDGSSYNIVPLLAPHEFNPSGKRLFISDESQVHNSIDFIDISSFKVNGSVVYRNTTLGVKGVKLFVDGEPVIGPDLRQEITDEQGRFEILVPIGDHYISLQKDGHSFEGAGRYPFDAANPDSIVTFNFVQNLTFGKPFIDTTLVTVIGRVIGGTSSNTIAMGFEQASNNIGKATISIDHSSSNPELTFDTEGDGLGNDTIAYSVLTEIDETGDSTITDVEYIMNRTMSEMKIYTSRNSGEFIAKLIPEKFSIANINVDNDIARNVKNFFGNKVIDLSLNTPVKYEILKDENGLVLDSVPYHFKFNYIYQTEPEISVTNINDTQVFYGEKDYIFTDPTDNSQDTIDIPSNFKYPIFKMMNDYSPKISIFESYENYDMPGNPARFTRQSIKEAEIKIINDLAVKDNVKTYKLTPEMDGLIIDTFKVGIPNITKSEFDQTSFTKTLQINVDIDGNSFPWLVDGKLYRAYIIGQRPKGNNFYTEGPQVPEIILRDPPGSRSSAYIEKGSSYSVSSSYSTDFNTGSGFGAEILLGVEVAAGGGLAGPVIKTDTKNSGKTGLSFSTSINTSGEYVKSYEFSERVETSSDPGMVGSMADIYIGKSYNYFYGETDHLKIIPYNLATTNGIISLDAAELEDTQYTLGIVEGFLMNPDNSDTYFKYTQAHVLNKLLPELESRRNNLFLTSKRSDGVLKYTSAIDNSDLRYGIAHSYEVETSVTDTLVKAFFKMSDTDSILTYSFRPEQQKIADLNNILNDTIYEIDSIRYYNSQIGIWVDAIRLNETEKAMAISSNTLEQNISFDGGVGSISRKEVQTISYNKEESRTKNMNFSAQGSVGFTFNKAGLIATGEISIAHSLGVSSGESFSQSMEYGYTLEDGDVGDYYSINVLRRPESGVYNASDLQETKMSMPSGFDFGSLGTGVALVGGGIAVAAASSYNAGGGIPIVAGAAVMAVAAGLSYIPYVSFVDKVKEQGDRFSPGDIRVSSFDISSPIFSTLGGQTMCPFQGLEHTFFYRNNQGDSIVLHKATLQREKPEITAEPAEVHNVPITDKAFFNIKLANNTESGDDQWYTVSVDEKTNPYGAAVRIDGSTANKTILVPANTTVTKSLTIAPTNKSVMQYDSIGIVIHSTCQYDPTDFTPDISDTVFISASFQPACTNVEVLEPLDNWVVNVNDKDTMTIRLGGYNLAHDSFQSFRFEYKPSSGSIWVPVKYFVNDPLLANKDQIQDTILISGQPFVSFEWDMKSLKDRNYDIRAVSNCSDGSENESIILSGILDGKRPQIFGTPQPADGILNVDENISVQFNEPIEGGLLTEFNFDIKGTLNYYLLKHEAYIRLNGSTDYATIPEGISFNDKSFTIEFWVRPDVYENSVIFSQGNDPASNLEIGLNGTAETYFKIGNVEYSAPFDFTAIPADAWQHMAYVFDYENGDLFIYQNDVIILEVRSVSVVYNNMGKIYIGKSSVSGGDHFSGSLHELRIWSKYIAIGEIYSNQYTALSGNEVGLYGYWPIDEAFGALANDKAANRHMEIHTPWEAYPGGYSWDFSGNNFLKFYTGYFSIIPEMDYTMEFWFKSDNPTDTVTLFSNQKGDGKESTSLLNKTLSVFATPNGKIWVASKGNLFEAVSTDYFDNTWHQFSLVVRRMGNVISFIDGQPQNEKENSRLGGIAGGNMVLGARKWNNISGAGEDHYYDGKLDEFRLWNLAKTTTQIRMDMNSKLHGDEIGLMVYLPFEGYYEDNKGVSHHTPTLENFVTDVNASDAIPNGINAFTTDAPNMKDVRPVQSIAYDFVSSEDKIIINPKTYLFPQLEKNIIEITVEKVEDKYGNRMASPVTWTAYVHRNQVRWEDERRSFTKELYKPFNFVSTIKNTGGQQVGFTIANLPPWLTANPTSGNINPESTMEITFTVNPALNIGEYNEDIILRTENGFDEKLPITMRVYKTAPDWKVDPSKFESTMNMVGRVKIEGVLSTDIFDKVAVFVNDSIRGVANVRYLDDFDSYLIFLNVYGNVTGDQLDFRIWDASVGQILDNVSPFNITFVPNGVEGTTLDPVIFEATGLYRQYIPMANGWNWVSFNKLSSNQNNLNSFFAALEPEQNDQVKTHGFGFNNYDLTTGWAIGGIDSIDNRQMYQIKLSNKDTIVYSGEDIVPEDNPIDLTPGWNHISYLPDLAMDVNDALRLYVADTSDIIKSQYAFSMFDPRAGWLGTLDVMKPGLGYMLSVKQTNQLRYPNTTIFKGVKIPNSTSPPSGWNNDLSAYSGNLSIVAQIDVEPGSNITVNSQMVLGAFIDGECHGFISPITNAGIGYDPFFLNVSNNTHGQAIKFRLFDGLTGLTYEINEIKPFAQNAVYGSTQNPLKLTIKGLTTNAGSFNNESFMRAYPNPFNDQINIEFAGASNALQIDVVNATGSVVQRIFEGYPIKGTNKLIWNGRNQNGTSVSSGIYYIRFVSGNAVETIKISKTR